MALGGLWPVRQADVRKQNWSKINRRQKACKMSKHFSKAIILSRALVAPDECAQLWIWLNLVSVQREGHRLDRIWNNWVSARRVLVRNCLWTQKCSDGRAKFFNTLSCLCGKDAFIQCSNLLIPAAKSVHVPYWFESIVRNDCREGGKWILLIEVYTYFKTYSLGPLSSKMFWFQLSWHVWTMPSWGDWGWNIFVTLFMKLFKT